MLFDLKVINSVLDQLEQERGVPRASVLEAIEMALATAYKKEYGKKGQIVRAKFDLSSGKTEFFQVKIVVDNTRVIIDRDNYDVDAEENKDDERVFYNPEHHILIEDAKKIKKDATLDEEIVFPLESKGDFGRIASQTAKQVIMQKIREAERVSVFNEYGEKEGEIITGTVQRIERGNIFVDVGRATGILPYEEQIPGERYSQGERVRAYLYRVEDSPKGVFLRLSRSHPKLIEKLFELEAPEISNGTVVVKAIAREAGARSKIAVHAVDEHIDPVGSLVGQRGVRVSTVMSELGGEKIDIIEWSSDHKKFIEDALSPAKVLGVEIINEAERLARVEVAEDQQSLAIGKGGQNVRLAAKLTGWKIDIQSAKGEPLASAEAPEDTGVETENQAPDFESEPETKETTEASVEETGDSKKNSE